MVVVLMLMLVVVVLAGVYMHASRDTFCSQETATYVTG